MKNYIKYIPIEFICAWILAIIWISPLLYAFWAAFHSVEYAIHFNILAPLTLINFIEAWDQAPFARYFLNTFFIVSSILIVQFIVCTLAAYAFARFEFFGKKILFAIILIQLMVVPEILIVENYKIMSDLNLVDTIFGVGLPIWQVRLAYSF